MEVPTLIMPETLEDCLDLILAHDLKQKDRSSQINKRSWILSNHNIGAMSNYGSDWKACPLLVKAVLKYCLPLARSGNVCNKAMIFMAGQSGAGKSSTISRLFNDDNLCLTSDRNFTSSTTSEVEQIGKELSFFDGDLNANIRSSLIFIDIPGSMDTMANREQGNYATVQRYLKNSPDLAEREGDYAKFLCQRIGAEKCANIPDAEIQNLADAVKKHICPNLVLLCVRSNDSRMEGTDSAFSQTLRNLKSLGVVDTQHLNLIVVVTCAMMIPDKKYQQKTEDLKEFIREAFSATFGIGGGFAATPVSLPIVFVENEPHNYEDVKMIDGFLKLPNGETSHLNLIRAMEEVFGRNGNELAMRICGRYFSDNCPEKKIKPKITVMSKASTPAVAAGTIAGASAFAAAEEPHEVHAGAHAAAAALEPDHLQTRYIGHGYCPITERIKVDTVLPRETLKRVRILGRELWIPERIDVFDEHVNFFEQITQQTKEEYEKKKKVAYGLDADISLAVSVIPEGKWVPQSKRWSDTSTISFQYVMQMISLQMTEIKDAVKPELMMEIGSLPSEYNITTSDFFTKFFSNWGTHFVWRAGYGGAIVVDYRIELSKYNYEDVQKVKAELQAVFSALPGKQKFKVLNTGKKSMSSNSNTRLMISGGRPPHVTLLEFLTPEMFSEWTASLEQNFSELEHTVKLYPYYDLAQGEQSKSLKDATLAYLEAGKKREQQSLKIPETGEWRCTIM